MTNPRVIDNDDGEIIVVIDGAEARGWTYDTPQERLIKMLCAREYVEGWCDGREYVPPIMARPRTALER